VFLESMARDKSVIKYNFKQLNGNIRDGIFIDMIKKEVAIW